MFSIESNSSSKVELIVGAGVTVNVVGDIDAGVIVGDGVIITDLGEDVGPSSSSRTKKYQIQNPAAPSIMTDRQVIKRIILICLMQQGGSWNSFSKLSDMVSSPPKQESSRGSLSPELLSLLTLLPLLTDFEGPFIVWVSFSQSSN